VANALREMHMGARRCWGGGYPAREELATSTNTLPPCELTVSCSLRNTVTFDLLLCVSGSKGLRPLQGLLIFVQSGDSISDYESAVQEKNRVTRLYTDIFAASNLESAGCLLGYLHHEHSG
jgi:hypothetical protein